MPEFTPIPIKELLIEATFAPNRALRAGVEAINLGVLGQEAERLHDLSASGDQIEYLVPAIITPDRRLFLRNTAYAGDKNSVQSLMEIQIAMNWYTLPKERRQNYFLAANIHNHPMPAPPSPQDLGPLFLTDNSPEGHTAVFTASELEKIVIFRGQNTPNWEENFIDQKIESWTGMLKERIMSFLNKGTSFSEELRVNRNAQFAFLRDVSSKYDLQAFSCPLRENIARRMKIIKI